MLHVSHVSSSAYSDRETKLLSSFAGSAKL